jgi:hypothetical protein
MPAATTLFAAAIVAIVLFLGVPTPAQRVAILTPERTENVSRAAEQFASVFGERFKTNDLQMAATAFASARPGTPFNMTDAEARAAAIVTGCDTLVLLRSETLRRSSLQKPEYYEAYLVVFVVDGRSGQLMIWDLASFENDKATEAEKRLVESTPGVASSVADRIANAGTGSKIPARPKMEEVTADTTAADLKPPIPYRRNKPEYTKAAYLYGVRATVEAEADIDETGKILRTAVVRWAGYGLDEAVITAVRSMNWRPAYRAGKPLPMRVLLRYNFTRIEKD